MTIFVQFNFPPDNATVSFGTFSIEDQNKSFRVGLINRTSPDMIRWHEEPREWKSCEEIRNISFGLCRDDIVIVEKKMPENEDAESRIRVELGNDWPPNAHGGTSVDRPYIF